MNSVELDHEITLKADHFSPSHLFYFIVFFSDLRKACTMKLKKMAKCLIMRHLCSKYLDIDYDGGMDN